MHKKPTVFPEYRLPTALLEDLERFNPWRENGALPLQPTTRRNLVKQMRKRLNSNIAPILAVRGPRQVGKTTAQLQIIQDLLAEGINPKRILRVEFDDLATLAGIPDPMVRIAVWFEKNILPRRFNAMAQTGERAFLFFNEVQILSRWEAQLKSLVDNATVKVVITGSSALRIERGRDSLAGRIGTLEAGVLSLTEIGALRGLETPEPFLEDNGLAPLLEQDFWSALRQHGIERAAFRREAFFHFAERGGYPVVHREKDEDFRQLAVHLNETVIQRVIQHDLRRGPRGQQRDARLLAEIFRLTCRYAGQTPATITLAEEATHALGVPIGGQRVNNYLGFLSDALLIRLIPPLEIRLKRKRGPFKLCLVDHGLRVSWLQERIPLAPTELARRPELTVLAGHLAESVFGATVSAIYGLEVAHFPGRRTEPEVDFVLTLGYKRIPVEIKYQKRIDPFRDTLGLRSFLEKTANNAPFGLLITQDDAGVVNDPRIVSLPLSTFMLLR